MHEFSLVCGARGGNGGLDLASNSGSGLVEEALAAATSGDLTLFERLLVAVTAPYDERPGLDRYAEPAPVDFGSSYQTFCGT